MSKTIDNNKLIAEDYELLNRKKDIFKQKAFFKKIVDKYSIKSCLDCACGAGWHLYMLNNMGINCFGSDLSPKCK